MKSKILYLAMLVLLAQCVTAQAEVVDKIIVVVNGELITQRELDRVLDPIHQQYRTIYSGDELTKKMEEAEERVLQQMIDDKLILSEAKKQNIQVDELEITSRIEDIKKRIGSREEFDRALAEQGITQANLRDRYREQMMSRKLVDEKVGSRVSITPGEINEYYANHLDLFTRPEEVKLRDILIRPKEGRDPAKSAALAIEIRRRLKEGGDFEALAKLYSDAPDGRDGGMLGYVKKGDLLPQLEKVIFNLKAGETSNVVQSANGYYIFRVEDKKEAKVLPITDVRRDVEEALFNEKIRDSIKDWVESLKKNAYIEYK